MDALTPSIQCGISKNSAKILVSSSRRSVSNRVNAAALFVKNGTGVSAYYATPVGRELAKSLCALAADDHRFHGGTFHEHVHGHDFRSFRRFAAGRRSEGRGTRDRLSIRAELKKSSLGIIMDIRSVIFTTSQTVAAEQEKTLLPLTDDLPLLECGLDSLCVALIVARLEDALGLDPFSTEENIEFPATVGDFVKLYEDAAAASVR